MPSLLIILLAATVVMAISVGWVITLFILIGCAVSAAIIATILYYKRTVFSLGRTKTFRKCQACTGGVQILYHRDGHDEAMTWGPIPPEWNMIQKDGHGWGTIEPPVANKRTCARCLGKGSHIMIKDDMNLPMNYWRR